MSVDEEPEENAVESRPRNPYRAPDADEEAGEPAVDTDGGDEEASDPNGFLDESNPFYIPKKQAVAAADVDDSKKSYKDTSDAANDILRKMIDRRRASR